MEDQKEKEDSSQEEHYLDEMSKRIAKMCEKHGISFTSTAISKENEK